MAGGPFANFGSPVDPMAILRLRAQQNAQPGQGASPPPAPVVAPPPVAPAVPSPSSDGGSGFMGGIGTALSNVMSGQGLLGPSGQGEIDPTTGLGSNEVRRSNMQGLTKVGLLLMAAGMRQSDDSRARMLGAAAQASDNSADLNKFAHSRIEMAKMRLLEKEELRKTAEAAQWAGEYGPAATGAATPVVGSPVTGPATGTVAPVGAPVAPGAVAPVSAVPSGPAGAVAPAPAGGVAPAPAGGVAPAPAGVAGLPTTAPPPPPPPVGWQPKDENERRMIFRLGREKGQQYVAERMKEVANDVVMGDRYLDPNLGIVADEYKMQNGKMTKVGVKVLGAAPTSIVTSPGREQGETIQRKVDASGRTIEEKPLYSPQEARLSTAETDILKGRTVDLTKRFEEDVKSAVPTYKRLNDLREKVLTDKSITGTGTAFRKSVFNVLGTLDALPKDTVERIQTSDMTQADLTLAAAEFAKKYMGPSVSDNDRQAALEFLGATASNDKYRVATALDRIIDLKERSIVDYSDAASFHNKNAPRSSFKVREVEGFTPIERKPVSDYVPKENTSAPAGTRQTPAIGAPAAPAGPPMPKGYNGTPAGWALLAPEYQQYYINKLGGGK